MSCLLRRRSFSKAPAKPSRVFGSRLQQHIARELQPITKAMQPFLCLADVQVQSKVPPQVRFQSGTVPDGARQPVRFRTLLQVLSQLSSQPSRQGGGAPQSRPLQHPTCPFSVHTMNPTRQAHQAQTKQAGQKGRTVCVHQENQDRDLQAEPGSGIPLCQG